MGSARGLTQHRLFLPGGFRDSGDLTPDRDLFDIAARMRGPRIAPMAYVFPQRHRRCHAIAARDRQQRAGVRIPE